MYPLLTSDNYFKTSQRFLQNLFQVNFQFRFNHEHKKITHVHVEQEAELLLVACCSLLFACCSLLFCPNYCDIQLLRPTKEWLDYNEIQPQIFSLEISEISVIFFLRFGILELLN